MSLTSDEINLVIHQYLRESNFTHSAFALYHESSLQESSLYGKKSGLEPGRLVQILRKGLLFIQVEEALKRRGKEDGSPRKSSIELTDPPRLLDDINLGPVGPGDLSSGPKSPAASLAPQGSTVNGFGQDASAILNGSSEDKPGEAEGNPKGSKRQKTTSSGGTKSGNKVSFRPSPPSSPISGNAKSDHKMDIDEAPATEAIVDEPAASPSDKKTPLPNKESGNGLKVQYLKGHSSEIVSAAWNPSATNILVTGGGDASARIWDVSTTPNADGVFTNNHNCRHLPALPDQKTVSCLDWHPEGSLLATGSMDGQARLWTPEGDLHAVSASHGNAIYALKFNPAGTLLVTVSQDTNVIASDLSGRKKASWSIHPGSAMDIDWLDADTFATCSKDVKICRASNSGTVSAVFKGHTGEINVIRWHGSGDGMLASCGDEGEVRIWKYDTSKPGQMDKEETKAIHVFRGPKEMYCMRWQPWTKESINSGSRILAAGSFDGVVRCFDAVSGTTLHTLVAHEEHIYSIAFSPTHPWLLGTVSLDRRLILWDTVSGEKVLEYTAAGGILDLAWKADGTQLALCTAAKIVPLLTIKADEFKRTPAPAPIAETSGSERVPEATAVDDPATPTASATIPEAEAVDGELPQNTNTKRTKAKATKV